MERKVKDKVGRLMDASKRMKTLRIINFGLLFALCGASAAFLAGFVDFRFLLYVIAATSGLLMVILYVMFITIMNHMSNVTIQKGTITEKDILANVHILDKPITPTNPLKNCIFRVMLEMKNNNLPELFVIRKCEKDTCVQKVNENIPLVLGKIHIFDITIDSQEKINFAFDKDTSIKKFAIQEFYAK